MNILNGDKIIVSIFILFLSTLATSELASVGIQNRIDRINHEIESGFVSPPVKPLIASELSFPRKSLYGDISSTSSGIRPSFSQIVHLKENRQNPAPHLLTRAIVIIRGNGPVRGVLNLQQMVRRP